MSPNRKWANAVVFALSCVGSLLALELVFRIVDKHSLTRLALAASAPVSEPAGIQGVSPDETAAFVERLPVAPGVDRRWYFDAVPEVPRQHVDEELQALYDREGHRLAAPFDLFKSWNAAFVRQEVCRDDRGYFRDFPGFAFAYEPGEPGPYPRYRFLPSITTPLGLVTNRFGWRGRELEAVKPPGVVRVAFLGASTTSEFHAEPFAYPDYVEHWLNRWATARHLGVRFEALNTGREGIATTDMAAIVRQELAPLAPDILVYYEGANQFSLGWLAREVDASAPTPARAGPPAAASLTRYSALARRLQALREALAPSEGAEPPKPAHTLRWPESLDELEPRLDAAGLPLELVTILRDLESIRRDSQALDARLVMTSFLWMVWDGMVLDPRRQPAFRSYFAYLNESMAPHRYADIRRVADFQNRVYRLYAEAADLPFIDLAADFPREPRYFVDPIHNTPDGSRLRAWLVFQGLVPIVEAHLATAHAKPLHPTPPRGPAMPTTARLDFDAIRHACAAAQPAASPAPPPPERARGRVRLADLAWQRHSTEVQHEWRRGGLLVTTDATPRGRALSSRIDPRGAGEALVRVKLRLRSGGVKLVALQEGQPAERTLLFLRPGTQEASLRVPLSGPGKLELRWANARPGGGRSIFRILELDVALP